jgi:hypothetical protein
VAKDSHPISIEQQSWQNLVAGIVISFEVICILLSATNKIMLFIGVGGAIGFALLFFNRQFREKYLGYQGDSSQAIPSPANFKTTQSIVEQSLLLWMMAVLLAITAFIGLDLATHAAFSLLAIPFGIAGSLWSYRRRYLTRHPLTYLVSTLAIMLILTCLGSAFWGQTIEKAKNFLGSDRDLVLPLAASFLLVAVQLARMWSLGYQRGLASSVLISAMLMVSTVLIGNNFGFLLILALFIGLLVPTLMLLYRSKINLKPIGLSIVPRPQQLTEKHVPWKYLTQIAVTSVVLGCILSLFAPQLRLPDVSWDWPGVDQIVKNLPIQTDPNLPDSVIKDLKAMEGITDDGSSGKGNPSKENFGGGRGSAVQSGGGNQFGSAGQPNSGSGTEAQQSDDSGVMDERLARQAIQNILATADRPLKTKVERRAYIQKYLQEHIQSPDCGPNNSYCFNSSLNNNLKSDQLINQHQTGLASWNPIAQIPLLPYYVAQQPNSSLLRQLTIPCPADQKDCYKYRVFQANKKESIRTHNRLLRSIGGIDLTEDNPDKQNSSQNSGSSGSSGGQGSNQGFGSSGNSGGQGGSQGSGSSGNSGGQGGSQDSGSSGNSGGQGGSQGFGSSGAQSGNQGFRFPWSSSDGQSNNQGSGSSGSSGTQSNNQGSGSSGSSGTQSNNQGSGSSGSSGAQSNNQGFRFPWSSSDGQSTDRGSGSSDTASNRQNGSQNSGATGEKNNGQQNGATGKSLPDSPDNLLRHSSAPVASTKGDRGQKNTPKDTNNSDNDRITNQNPGQTKPQLENISGNPIDKKSPDQPPKLPPINAEQLTNLLRIIAVILMLVAGVAWYLQLQSRQEKTAKQKERKFNQLPTIERIYWLMLKDLRTSGSIKHSNETEWEFALSKTQQLNTNELRYPGLLGKLITEISDDYVAWRYGKKPPNDSSINHKFERFRELHSEFHATEQARHKAASGIFSQAKNTFTPVK